MQDEKKISPFCLIDQLDGQPEESPDARSQADGNVASYFDRTVAIEDYYITEANCEDEAERIKLLDSSKKEE